MAGLDPTNLLQAPVDQSQALQNPYPSGYMTPDMRKAMYDYSQALLKNSETAVPGTKGGWTVGVQHIVDALMGGQQAYAANKGELGSRRYDAAQQPQAPGPFMYPPNSNDVSSASSDALPEGAENSSSKGDPRKLTEHIKETAKKYGVNPEVAMRVAGAEGLSNPVGDNGTSFGAFQLHTGGGLGDKFKQTTGLDPADPKNEKATIDFALKEASNGGWGPWTGARKLGLAPNAGIPALAFNGQPSQNTPAADAMALALAKGGKPAAGTPGVPAGGSSDTTIAPFAINPRTKVGREQFERMMGSPWMSDAQKEQIRNEYMQQNFPVTTPYLGGNIISDPNDPRHQFYSPGVQWNEFKSGASSGKVLAKVFSNSAGIL